jgi:hypothetical protein
MSDDERELLKNYRNLMVSNRQIASSNVRVMVAAQENTKRQYGLDTPLFNGATAARRPAAVEKRS